MKLGEALPRAEAHRRSREGAAGGVALRRRRAARAVQPGAHRRAARRSGGRAKAAYETEAAANPDNYGAQFNLGKLLLKEGRLAEATARFRAAVDAQAGVRRGLPVPCQGAPRRPATCRARRKAAQRRPGATARPHHRAAWPLRARRRLQPHGPRERSGPRGGPGPRAGAWPMKASRRAELQLRPQAAPKSRPTPAIAVLVAIVTGSRLAADRRRRRPRRAADAAPSGPRHHRHAARRPARRLRQHHGADAELRSDRARGRAGARRDGPRADHPPVARLALYRPLPRRPRRARQHLAAARQGRADAGRDPVGQGFATAAFVSSFVLSSPSGLDRGFDHYDDRFDVPQRDEALSRSAPGAAPRRRDAGAGRTVARRARSPEARAKRTALWVHLYDPHDPYEPPEPFATRFADRLYDGEVAWTDTLLGRLRAGLESRGLWDDALVVVTADHGEALGEHDETGHGFFAYETTLRVPLVMRGPGVAGRTRPRRHASGSSTSPRPCSTCSACRRWPARTPAPASRRTWRRAPRRSRRRPTPSR